MRRIEHTGTIGVEGTGDVLRDLESAKMTARVWFETEIGVGQVAFCQGNVVVAEVGPLRRRSALLRILGITEGQYSVEETDVPAGPPIVQSVDAALATLVERQDEWRKLCESTPPMSAVLRLTASGRETKRNAKGAERLVYLLVDGRRSLMEILSEATVDPIEALRIVVRGEAAGHFEEASVPSTLYPLALDEPAVEVSRLPLPPGVPRLAEASPPAARTSLVTSNDLAYRKSTLVGLGTECSSSAPPPPVVDSIQTSPIIDVAGETGAFGAEDALKPDVIQPVAVERRVLGATASDTAFGRSTSDAPPISEPVDSLLAASVPEREPEPGQGQNRARYVGRYEIIHRIGRGGMGSVYLARLTAPGGFRRLFALKLLRSYLARDGEAAEAFLAEARLAGQLHHTNVVGVVDAGVHRGQPFLVMDYVEGCSFKQLVASDSVGRSLRQTVPILLDALAGLQALHNLSGDDGAPLDMVHCDVSPENLLVGTDGVCRLTDFGVARRSRGQSAHITHGKPGYLAPEQVLGRAIDRRVDIFAMGVVLWSALTGERLFHGASVDDTLQRVCSQPIVPPSSVGLHPPKEFDEVVLKALERDPAARYETAEAMQIALRDVAVRGGYLGLPSEAAAWVRHVVGRELSYRRLLILDATRPAGSTIPPGQLSTLSSNRTDGEYVEPMSSLDAAPRLLQAHRDETDSHTIPLSQVREGGSRLAVVIAGVLAAAAVVTAILWPSALSKLVKLNAPTDPQATGRGSRNDDGIAPQQSVDGGVLATSAAIEPSVVPVESPAPLPVVEVPASEKVRAAGAKASENR